MTIVGLSFTHGNGRFLGSNNFIIPAHVKVADNSTCAIQSKTFIVFDAAGVVFMPSIIWKCKTTYLYYPNDITFLSDSAIQTESNAILKNYALQIGLSQNNAFN